MCLPYPTTSHYLSILNRRSCDSKQHDSSEEIAPLGQCPRPIPTRRGVLGNWEVSQLEGKAQPTCQPPGRGEARGRPDGFACKLREFRWSEVAWTTMLGKEGGWLIVHPLRTPRPGV